MPKLTFFHQVRVDGGVRTGIEIDDAIALEFFQTETEEFDPVLLWYVDIVCDGDNLPGEPETARQWFLDNERFFVDLLLVPAADELEIGFDPEVRPFRRIRDAAPGGCRAVMIASAMRRVHAREIAGNLRRVAESWRGLLTHLERYSLV